MKATISQVGVVVFLLEVWYSLYLEGTTPWRCGSWDFNGFKKMKKILLLFLVFGLSCSEGSYPEKIELVFRDQKSVVVVTDEKAIEEIYDLLEKGEKNSELLVFVPKIWINTSDEGKRTFGVGKNRFIAQEGQYILEVDLEKILRDKFGSTDADSVVN